MRFILPALLLGALAASGVEQADLVLWHGKVVTLDPQHPTAQAIAVRAGKVLATGSDAAMRALAGPQTRLIDLGGQLAIPGFIEGHGHFMGVGSMKMSLNLRYVKDWDEIVVMVAEAAKKAPPGTWILGRGWQQAHWERPPNPNVEGFPIDDALSKVSPNNPVWLTHASGHAAMVNAAALKAAEITAKTPDPPGGHILKDKNGQPTGFLQERAQLLLEPAYKAYRSRQTPAELRAEARTQAELAMDECVSNGITTFEDAGSPLETVDMFKQIGDEGAWRLRMWVMLRAPNAQLAGALTRYRIQDADDHHLTVRAIKRQMDGALGSRGAWLLEPYSDLPSSTGLNTEPVDDIRKTAELAIANGYQLCVHAIGDRANRETLNIFESVFREHPDKKNLRWRVEHAQHLNPADIPRFARLGVIASMQAVHCTSDAPMVIPRLGFQRAKEGAYVWRSLIDSGAMVTNGTDAPVEEVNPIAGFYAAITRKTKDGTAFFPEQRMTRDEALRAYTINNAYAAFEENSKGSLVPGKLADITVLSKDIMTVPEDEILSTGISYTIVGGKIAYSSRINQGRPGAEEHHASTDQHGGHGLDTKKLR